MRMESLPAALPDRGTDFAGRERRGGAAINREGVKVRHQTAAAPKWRVMKIKMVPPFFSAQRGREAKAASISAADAEKAPCANSALPPPFPPRA